MATLLRLQEWNSGTVDNWTVSGPTIYPADSVIETQGNGIASQHAYTLQANGCDFLEARISTATGADWAWLKFFCNSATDLGYNNNGIGIGVDGASNGQVFLFGTFSAQVPTGNYILPLTQRRPAGGRNGGSVFSQTYGLHRVSPTIMDVYLNRRHIIRGYTPTATAGAYIQIGSYNNSYGQHDYVAQYNGNPYAQEPGSGLYTPL